MNIENALFHDMLMFHNDHCNLSPMQNVRDMPRRNVIKTVL